MEERLLLSLKPLCIGIDEEILRDFVSRMDPEYFDRFQPKEIARHISLVDRLDPDHPCQVDITLQRTGLYDLVIVAYDYFSEFATICGLLSAFGLDIRAGHIYTFAEAQPVRPSPAYSPLRKPPSGRRRSGLARKKIVDWVQVRPLATSPWLPDDQRRFVEELTTLLQLLEARRYQEARGRINRQLVETLSRARGRFPGLLHPVYIQFDNEASLTDTVMDIRSTDTPAFLYAFANALSMRGIYIHKAGLETIGPELHDRLYVRDRHGHKITDAAAQHELRATAVLIKQFTQFLTWAPDPAKAVEYFDQFLDRILGEAGHAPAAKALKLLKHKQTLALLARLLGSSEFLWEDFLRRQHANLLPLLESYQRFPLVRRRTDLTRELRMKLGRAKAEGPRRRIINEFKDEEMFRIDMKHLAEPSLPL